MDADAAQAHLDTLQAPIVVRRARPGERLTALDDAERTLGEGDLLITDHDGERAIAIAGVMGGIAHRYGWSSTLLRVIFVIVSIASAAFPGILVYLILWLLMPNEQD